MNKFIFVWRNNPRRIVFLVYAMVLIVGGFFYNTGCRQAYESQFELAMQNENYLGAKTLLYKQIAEDSFTKASNEEMAKAYYKLAFAHGKLSEYDSMKYALDQCLLSDNNYTRLRREMLEYFSIDEFNKAVILYNSFFYDKAIMKLEIAIQIVGTESPYEEYSALIFRSLAYAEASKNNIDIALEYCKKAANLGDALSKKILDDFQQVKKITPPEKLQPHDQKNFTI